MQTEVANRAKFFGIRYAQVWEDGDILLRALDIQPGDHCFSVASAGDNALLMLTCDPASVVAVDLSPAQIACLELRVAALRTLDHAALLEFHGSRPSTRRAGLYKNCRPLLSQPAAAFWDAHAEALSGGFGSAGRFENYFRIFRERLLPLVHGRNRIQRLLKGGSPEAREIFYEKEWNTLRWRLLFRFFFSRTVMGFLGRSPAFFRYVEGSVAERILGRTRHALTYLDPSANPWLHWILTGTHGAVLPPWLEPANHERIVANLDRLTWRIGSVEQALDDATRTGTKFSRFNLSDIFEYMSEENTLNLLGQIAAASAPNARLCYWNMLAPRSGAGLPAMLAPLDQLAKDLFPQDRAFFYSRLVVEQVPPPATNNTPFKEEETQAQG